MKNHLDSTDNIDDLSASHFSSDSADPLSDSGIQYSSEKSVGQDNEKQNFLDEFKPPSDWMEGRSNAAKSGMISTAGNSSGKKSAHSKPEIDKNNNTINTHIQESLRTKVEDLVEVFRKNYSATRPYCNRVTVRVARSELMQIQSRRQVIYLEQEFKLEKDTDFETLKTQCCRFWGLSESEYSLYDSKYSHLMALNDDKAHPAHKVTNYFEVLKMRDPLLYLLRDELERAKITDSDAA